MCQTLKLIHSICLATVVLAGFYSQADADVISIQERIGRRPVVVYKMTISPAAEAVPAFRHRLTVPDIDKIPGNAVTHYLRSLGENSLNGITEHFFKTYGNEHDGWDNWSSTETPVEKIPMEKLREASLTCDGYVSNHLKRASMCRDADWGLAEETLSGSETVGFLLPSVQQTRSMARLLMLRNRLAVIDGRFEDSIEHLRMTYQLGQDVSEMKFLVAKLVGIAEVGIANEGMMHLIAADGSPNMYWALAELPQPIVSIRDSVRLEASFAIRYFPVLMDIESAEHSPEQWAAKLTEVFEDFELASKMTGRGKDIAGLPGLGVAAALASYSSAKKRLVENGMDAEQVEKMAVAHVVLLDASQDYQLYADAMESIYYLPQDKFQVFADRFEKKIRDDSQLARLGAVFADLFLPAMVQVRNAETRVQSQINVLQAIEAIRDHVATQGELPATLEEMDLPVRLDPLTSKPFKYQLDGDKAVLSIKANVEFRYEIKIAPKK